MTMASAYFFNIPGNPTVQISKDELRSLLREIESELHRSKVYRLAVANVQKLLGSSDEQAATLFKAVGREAISLAFKQFAKKHQPVTEINSKIDNIEVANEDSEQSHDSPQSLKIITSDTQLGLVDNAPSNLSSTSPLIPDVVVNTIVEDQPKAKTPNRWLWQNQKLSKSELEAQLAAEQRVESLRQIGQQLRQARESQGLTLQKLNIYTHISIHQMEAVEKADLESLPEDVLVRGFIRVMGNALGLNGIILANNLPIPSQTKSVLPSWSNSHNSPGKLTGKLNLELRPMHLYVGYTALVAGALGGLSFVSQQANNDAAQNSHVIIPTSSSLCQSTQKTEANFKPGLKSSAIGVCIGSDISPPEAL